MFFNKSGVNYMCYIGNGNGTRELSSLITESSSNPWFTKSRFYCNIHSDRKYAPLEKGGNAENELKHKYIIII